MDTGFERWMISSLLHGMYDIWLFIGLSNWAYLQIIMMGFLAFGLGYHSLKWSQYAPPVSKEPARQMDVP